MRNDQQQLYRFISVVYTLMSTTPHIMSTAQCTVIVYPELEFTGTNSNSDQAYNSKFADFLCRKLRILSGDLGLQNVGELCSY